MQQRTGLLQQRESQISVPSTFVELVEQHDGHTVESRVGLKTSQKQPIGDHLHPSPRRALLLSTDREADSLTDLLPEAVRQACCSGFCRQTPGFDHPDPSLPDGAVAHGAERAEESQRHTGCLASSGRSLKQHSGPRLQLPAEPRQQRIDRIGRQSSTQWTRFITPSNSRLLTAPKAASSFTRGPREALRLAIKTFLKAGLIPV